MLKNSKRLIIIVIGTIVLPLVGYMVFEVSSLQEDEEVIQRIYENQLDFVIFSANQYSNDFLDGLVNSVEADLESSATYQVSPKTQTLLTTSGCLMMNLKPIDSTGVLGFGTTHPEALPDAYDQMIDSLHKSNNAIIGQLINYRKLGDYRKLEPNQMIHVDSLEMQVLYAVLVAPDGDMVLLTGLIEPSAFAHEVLSPKLQQIAQQDLVISLTNSDKDFVVLQTDSLSNEIIASGNMWLFPSMELGISLKNQTLKSLINQRLEYNLMASGILISLLLIGFVLIGRTIYQQMQLAQTKSDFVSNVSHELRTPLALISMFAETLLLQRVKTEEKKSEYIEIIFKETNRLTRIVNRILNFSQVEADRKKYHFISMDINAIVDELMHDYSFHLEHNGFNYQFEKVDELVNILADKETIYEALVNLMDNAIKYSRDEKFIAIRTKIRGEHAIIEVEDKGIGIPKENLKNIFDKFFRVSEGNVHTVQGAGLGLSLVSSIMDAHGGNIELESKLGEGSIFRLVFNLSEAQQTANSTLQEPQLIN